MKYRTTVQGHIEYVATMTGAWESPGAADEVEIEVRCWHGSITMAVRTKQGWANIPLPGDSALELARLLTQVRGKSGSTPEGK